MQYIDDLKKICSKNLASCQQHTIAVLQALAEKGHKASKAKLQLWSEEGKYLGHTLKGTERLLTPGRVEAIRLIPKPRTPKQL